MIPLLIIIFGILCYSFGVYSATHRNECPDEIYGYYCRRGTNRIPMCDHSEVAVLEAKLAMARYREENSEKTI